MEGAVLVRCEGLLGNFLQSELLRAEEFLPSFLSGEERARGDVLLGGEGDDDLSQADCDAHLWDIRSRATNIKGTDAKRWFKN